MGEKLARTPSKPSSKARAALSLLIYCENALIRDTRIVHRQEDSFVIVVARSFPFTQPSPGAGAKEADKRVIPIQARLIKAAWLASILVLKEALAIKPAMRNAFLSGTESAVDKFNRETRRSSRPHCGQFFLSLNRGDGGRCCWKFVGSTFTIHFSFI